jgi:UDP-N-acetylmuramate: L-alanyl-gamma-D-glutamyl-meso-diaminopimelate ligase
MLAALGIPVVRGFRPENLEPAPDVVVVGNVVGRSNPEVEALLESGLTHLSMPQAMGEFVLAGRHPVVVVGTHGKTTTSALLSHVLDSAGRDPTYFVGGVLRGSERSFRMGSGPHVVVEGDEYETSFFDKGPKFLHYRPRTAILTSIEPDHVEMYPTIESLESAFRAFVEILPDDGLLVACAEDPRALRLAAGAACPVSLYGVDAGELTGRILHSGPDGTEMAVTQRGSPARFRMKLTGRHNVLNALAVVGVARSLGLADSEIAEGLASFPGVHRRQEVVGEAEGVIVLDDFAHHPTAVRETISAVRARFPEGRLWAIFEPRTNTSRRDLFQRDYALAFDGASRIVVAAVDHPEKAPEGHRLDVERLTSDLRERGLEALHVPEAEAIAAHVIAQSRPGDVVLVMSNGSFGGVHQKILDGLAVRERSRP